MNKTLTLNEQQWQLLIELLESEQKKLPAEIHHTDTADYKEKLSARLEIVRQSLETIRGL